MKMRFTIYPFFEKSKMNYCTLRYLSEGAEELFRNKEYMRKWIATNGGFYHDELLKIYSSLTKTTVYGYMVGTQLDQYTLEGGINTSKDPADWEKTSSMVIVLKENYDSSRASPYFYFEVGPEYISLKNYVFCNPKIAERNIRKGGMKYEKTFTFSGEIKSKTE